MRKKKGESSGEGEAPETRAESSPHNPTAPSTQSHSSQGQQLEQKILENLVELQKVHTSLAEKFDKLAGELSQLLTLFEMAARSFAEQPANQMAERDKDFLDKVDRLLEQNKTIAKALTLVEERMRERVYGAPVRPFAFVASTPREQKEKESGDTSSSQQPARPLPRF